MSYVSLHTHSHFSILDGLSTEDEIAQRTKELGQSAVALTDHGSLSGALKFQRACVENGVKPILGCEVYVAPGHRADHDARCVDGKSTAYHLILLAQNQTGWHNLVKLTTLANTEGFYRKPRVDRELLAQYNEGLICLSGCLGGELSQAILHDDNAVIPGWVIEEYREIFSDRYFLEIQRHGLGAHEERVNDALLDLSRKLNIPLVATGDSHYARIEDAELHDLLLCIQTLDYKSNPVRKFQFKGTSYHLMSDEEMWMLELPKDAYSNSGYIADTIEEITFDHTPHIPHVVGAPMKLRQALNSNPLTDDERERIARELEVISKHGFDSYFLIVADICKWARAHGITVGPGRGSAGGSLVAYMLGITDVDPLRFGTMFERFMTGERMKLPDIDIDFSVREPVIKYIQQKYGVDNVAQVATFSKFGEKSATRDIARALELDEWNPQVIAAADRLRGRVRGVSRHAAGVIISPEPLSDGVPLMRPVGATPGADKQTAWEYEDMEALGYLKVDILGVQRLQTIQDTAKYLNIDIERSVGDLDDLNVFLMLARGDVLGVFQLDSYGGKKTIRSMRPTCFEDIATAIALDRPGPMESGALDLYMQRRHSNKPYTPHEIPAVEAILKDTYGCLIYQEQVMEIAQKVAGYTPGAADEFRAAMGKKKPEQMAAQREKFITGVVQNSQLPTYAQAYAPALFDQIEFYAGYAFNRSHAIAYALIGYQCAWLKFHYPVAWYTALLNERRDEQTKLQETIAEVRRQGIAFLRADIYKSLDMYVAEDTGIRVGLTGLADFGKVAFDELRRALSENNHFDSLLDLVRHVRMNKLNSKAIGALIKAGALESLGDRSTLTRELPLAVEQKKREAHEAFKAIQHAKGLTLAGTPQKRPKGV